jgi:hypothetical protein
VTIFFVRKKIWFFSAFAGSQPNKISCNNNKKQTGTVPTATAYITDANASTNATVAETIAVANRPFTPLPPQTPPQPLALP